MKNEEYLSVDKSVKPELRLEIYNTALEGLTQYRNDYENKHGRGLCILLRNLLFDNTIAIEMPGWIFTSFLFPELTNNIIADIINENDNDVQIDIRIEALKVMIEQVKQLI